MSDVLQKLAQSLSANSVELLPYLPYLLQDLWELGSSPKDMIHLIKENIEKQKEIRVLDLACGKGAVSVNLAKTFGCKVKGIDLIPEFIEEAKKKAKEHQVENLCEFRVGDINQAVKSETGYDVVILGAVGFVLGNQMDTLVKLSTTIKPNGYILLDDGYAKEGASPGYLTRKQWLDVIQETGFSLIDELRVDEAEFEVLLSRQMSVISRRVKELKQKIPAKSHLFDAYLNSQMAEIDELENYLVGVTMLLKKVYSPQK